MFRWLEDALREEWTALAEAKRTEREGLFRRVSNLLGDPEVHHRLLELIRSGMEDVLLGHPNRMDFEAMIMLRRQQQAELEEIRSLTGRLRQQRLHRRSALFRDALSLIELAADEVDPDGLGPDPHDGVLKPMFELLCNHPGKLAKLVEEGRSDELDWDVERMMAWSMPDSPKPAGVKGYAGASLVARLMTDVIELGLRRNGRAPLPRSRVLRLVGMHLRAYFPGEFIGKTDERGMLDKYKHGVELTEAIRCWWQG